MKFQKKLLFSMLFIIAVLLYPVTVHAAVTDIELSKSSISLDVDETYQMIFQTKPAGLDLPEIKAVSSDPKVVTADKDGLLTAISEGSAVITFTSANGKIKQQCSVVVQKTESTKYSLLIIIIESTLLLGITIFFLALYKSFIRSRIKDEMKLKE